MSDWKLTIGANPVEKGKWNFRVWAPFANKVELSLTSNTDSSLLEMQREEHGYFSKMVNTSEGARYAYILDGKKRRADPASRYQPDGINTDSSLVDPSSFHWSDNSWSGVPQDDLIIYEMHVGTFSGRGTFESVMPFLGYLGKELGVTAIEIMPVAQFPGSRNWGYDGVLMYAVQNTYGGPTGLKKLVNAAHLANLAVILDVVYNHIGPEGNYLPDYGPYFSSKYQTPWGPAINYDGRGSDEVRNYVINNALYWINEYHMDGLRLDAVHGIFDFSPTHILKEMSETVKKLKKPRQREAHLIAESDLNDPRIILPPERCGYGLDAQWSDDFHHSIHSYFTSEKNGYYEDFGNVLDIEKAMRDCFVYDGRYSKYRNKSHGAPPLDLPGSKFVICIQNHDQVGNRPDGARVSTLLDEKASLKLATSLLLLAPYIPMLFMGEEYGERAPFYFFTSHIDPAIARATREGRKKEFESHHFELDFVDPQAESTFEKSKVNPDLRSKEPHSEIFDCYKQLITLRKSHPALRSFKKGELTVTFIKERQVLICERRAPEEKLTAVFVLNREPVSKDKVIQEEWVKIFSSSKEIEENSLLLPPLSATVYALL